MFTEQKNSTDSSGKCRNIVKNSWSSKWRTFKVSGRFSRGQPRKTQ